MKKAHSHQKVLVGKESGKAVVKCLRRPRFANDQGKPRHHAPHPKKQSIYAKMFWDSQKQGTMEGR